MGSYTVESRRWTETTGSGGIEWIAVYSSGQSAVIENDHWKFTISAYVANTFNVDITNWQGTVLNIGFYEDSARTRLIGSGSASVTGSYINSNGGTTAILATATANGSASVGTVYVTIELDCSAMSGGAGILYQNQGYYIKKMAEYGRFDVSDIPLNPNITSFTWDQSKIRENSMSFNFTADQDIVAATAVVERRIDFHTGTGEQSGTINLSLGGSGKNRSFTISSSDWYGIAYAQYYRVTISVQNASGRWNATTAYTKSDGQTGNHKPSISASNVPGLDSYTVYWGADIPSTIVGVASSHGSVSVSGNTITCTGVSPGTTATFTMSVQANRYYADSKFGSYTSDVYSIKINTLVSITLSASDFIFGDGIPYSISNIASSGCTFEISGILSEALSYSGSSASGSKSLSQAQLDALYKRFGRNNSQQVTIKVTSAGYSESKTVTCTLTGNAKTAHVGSGSNKPLRCKAFVGNSSNKPLKAVIWIGDSGTPRRCI